MILYCTCQVNKRPEVTLKTDTDQDSWVLHGDAGSRGSQGSTDPMVVLEADFGLSCFGGNEELYENKAKHLLLYTAVFKSPSYCITRFVLTIFPFEIKTQQTKTCGNLRSMK